MDKANEVILGTLYALSQQTSITFLHAKVSQKVSIPFQEFEARITDLGFQGYLRMAQVGRRAVLISLTQAGVDHVGERREAQSHVMAHRPINLGQAALIMFFLGCFLLIILGGPFLMSRWKAWSDN